MEPLLSWIDALWFQIYVVFWRLYSFSGRHPSIDQRGAIALFYLRMVPEGSSKTQISSFSAAYTPVVIPYQLPVKMLNVLRKG